MKPEEDKNPDDIIDALAKDLQAAGFDVQVTSVSLDPSQGIPDFIKQLIGATSSCDCPSCRLKRAIQTDPSLN